MNNVNTRDDHVSWCHLQVIVRLSFTRTYINHPLPILKPRRLWRQGNRGKPIATACNKQPPLSLSLSPPTVSRLLSS